MQHQAEILIQRLESIGRVSEYDRQALATLPMRRCEVWRGQDLRQEGEDPSECLLVLSGLLSSYKVFPDGRKQIAGFHVPGDIADLQTLFLMPIDCSVAVHSHSLVAAIKHTDLRALLRNLPNLANLFWRDSLIAASTYRTWVAAVGTLSVAEHLAHVICELYARLKAVGLARDNQLALPLTRTELAETLGVTSVTAGRALQELIQHQLIELVDEQVRILDSGSLRSFGQFDLTYLHLQEATL
jgi:CRP-like cAMP-binding protein